MHYKVLAASQEPLPCADVGLNITSETISFGVIPKNCPSNCYFILINHLIFHFKVQRFAATNGKEHVNPTRKTSPVVSQIAAFLFPQQAPIYLCLSLLLFDSFSCLLEICNVYIVLTLGRTVL